MGKRGSMCTVGGTANWQCNCVNQYGFLKILNTELPYDPEIPLIGIVLKKMRTIC